MTRKLIHSCTHIQSNRVKEGNKNYFIHIRPRTYFHLICVHHISTFACFTFLFSCSYFIFHFSREFIFFYDSVHLWSLTYHHITYPFLYWFSFCGNDWVISCLSFHFNALFFEIFLSAFHFSTLTLIIMFFTTFISSSSRWFWWFFVWMVNGVLKKSVSKKSKIFTYKHSSLFLHSFSSFFFFYFEHWTLSEKKGFKQTLRRLMIGEKEWSEQKANGRMRNRNRSTKKSFKTESCR